MPVWKFHTKKAARWSSLAAFVGAYGGVWLTKRFVDSRVKSNGAGF